MAVTRTAPSKAAEPKAHRSPRPAPTLELEYDAKAHQKEIAQVAYRIWLERADRPGSPEDDWLKAEAEVRARYVP